MKLEVGKKYVDGHGVVYEYVGKTTKGRYVFCDDVTNATNILTTDKPEYDVKEHIEPRTKDVWVWWNIKEGQVGIETIKVGVPKCYKDTTVVKKITLTEGEFDD